MYLKQSDEWTAYPDRAFDFPCSDEALTLRQKLQLEEASLVFCFDHEGYSITVPLDSAAPTNDSPAEIESRDRKAMYNFLVHPNGRSPARGTVRRRAANCEPRDRA